MDEWADRRNSDCRKVTAPRSDAPKARRYVGLFLHFHCGAGTLFLLRSQKFSLTFAAIFALDITFECRGENHLRAGELSNSVAGGERRRLSFCWKVSIPKKEPSEEGCVERNETWKRQTAGIDSDGPDESKRRLQHHFSSVCVSLTRTHAQTDTRSSPACRILKGTVAV